MRHDPLSINDSTSPVRPVVIFDRPCGTGKTTEMIKSFEHHKHYLIIVPLLTECERIIEAAQNRGITFEQPTAETETVFDDSGQEIVTTRKIHSLRRLLAEGQNVVTTHAMFDTLSDVVSEGLLDSYDIHIDEVLSVIDANFHVQSEAWDRLFIESGLCTVDPETSKVFPTDAWDTEYAALEKHVSLKFYKAAKSGRLFNVHNGFNVAVLPEKLLKVGKSLRIYTYKAEGSIIAAYLRHIGITTEHNKLDNTAESEFVREVRDLITVKGIKSLDQLSFSHTDQTDKTSGSPEVYDNLVPKALYTLARNALKDVPLENILLTCPKVKWFAGGKSPTVGSDGLEKGKYSPGPYAKGSRLQGRSGRVHWLPNTTRGTNDYKNATHLIYLYNQFLNPNILRFLGKGSVSQEDYALTELIQWVWRSQIRDGKPITVYLPSRRMRNLFLNWLWEGDIPTHVLREAKRVS